MGNRISTMTALSELSSEAWMEVIIRSGTGFVNRRVDIETLRRAIGTLSGTESAYEIAVRYGFKGTEKEWIDTLKGKSTYELAVKYGYEGTELEWITALTRLTHLNPEDNGKYLTNDGDKIRWVLLTPRSVGLDQVDNTADLDKPISHAVQEALDTKLSAADIQPVVHDGVNTVFDRYQITDVEGSLVFDQGKFN